MPNGGSDHCGYCRHNRVNIGRTPTRDERAGAAFCTVRNVTIRVSLWTYCANHYVDDRTPIGPMFTAYGDHERIPRHDGLREIAVAACRVCGAPSHGNEGVEVTDGRLGVLQFCGGRHYVRWWKQAHPGVPLTWDLDPPPRDAAGGSAHD